MGKHLAQCIRTWVKFLFNCSRSQLDIQLLLDEEVVDINSILEDGIEVEEDIMELIDEEELDDQYDE